MLNNLASSASNPSEEWKGEKIELLKKWTHLKLTISSLEEAFEEEKAQHRECASEKENLSLENDRLQKVHKSCTTVSYKLEVDMHTLHFVIMRLESYSMLDSQELQLSKCAMEVKKPSKKNVTWAPDTVMEVNHNSLSKQKACPSLAGFPLEPAFCPEKLYSLHILKVQFALHILL